MKRIVIADDHPVVRTGLQSILSRDPRFEVIGEAADPEQLEELLATRACELLITDLSMPWSRRPDGVRMLAAICRDYPGLPILVITTFSNEQILRAVAKLGVSGILDKTSALPVLIEAVDAALAGERYFAPVLEQRLRCKVQRGAGLTARESEVVRLLAHGLSVKDVADIHRRTISTISRQMRCLTARSRSGCRRGEVPAVSVVRWRRSEICRLAGGRHPASLNDQHAMHTSCFYQVVAWCAAACIFSVASCPRLPVFGISRCGQSPPSLRKDRTQ